MAIQNPKSENQNPKEPSFEQSLAELEEIAAQLEVGNTPLDESLALYEKGVAALKRCHAMLDKAEKRIRTLVQDAGGGVALREEECPKTAKSAGTGGNTATAPESGPPPSASRSRDGEGGGNTGASQGAALGAGLELRKTKKRASWPTVDTRPLPGNNPLAPNESSSGEAAQRPGKVAGSAGGSLFGGSQ
jgi:exodeoxyribonuclease VII small subunit